MSSGGLFLSWDLKKISLKVPSHAPTSPIPEKVSGASLGFLLTPGFLCPWGSVCYWAASDLQRITFFKKKFFLTATTPKYLLTQFTLVNCESNGP